MFYIFQTSVLFLLALIILYGTKNRYIKVGFSLFLSIFITLEIVSIFINDRFIDYRFYTHANLTAIKTHGRQFLSHALISSGICIALYQALKYLSSMKLPFKKRYIIPLTLPLAFILFLPNGIFSEIYQITKILNAKNVDFKNALKSIGIPPEKYIFPNEVKSKAGKNIIVISIESLEYGFIDGSFGNITPNILNLSKQWTFYKNLEQTAGANWTSASLYAHQTGMPAFFKAQGNSNFADISKTKLTGLGDVLNRANYDIKYIIGRKEFGGINDILKTYNIDAISEKNSIGKSYPTNTWGLNDYDIFNESKLWIKKFKENKNRPFALFISTVNTHYPDGIYDQRMKNFIPKRTSNIEFAISSVDYLIGNFIDFIKKENLLDSTSIYIFPDHIMMGNYGKTIDKLKQKKRKLFLLTNANENTLKKKSLNSIYQIDLPRMILDGAEINTNAKFFTDFIKTKDVNKFINQNIINITSLNHAATYRQNFKNGIKVEIKNPHIILKSEQYERKIVMPKSDNMQIDMTFNTEMNFLYMNAYEIGKRYILPPNDKHYDKVFKYLHLNIIIQNGKLVKVYLRNIKKSKEKTSKPFQFDKEEIRSLDLTQK